MAMPAARIIGAPRLVCGASLLFGQPGGRWARSSGPGGGLIAIASARPDQKTLDDTNLKCASARRANNLASHRTSCPLSGQAALMLGVVARAPLRSLARSLASQRLARCLDPIRPRPKAGYKKGLVRVGLRAGGLRWPVLGGGKIMSTGGRGTRACTRSMAEAAAHE